MRAIAITIFPILTFFVSTLKSDDNKLIEIGLVVGDIKLSKYQVDETIRFLSVSGINDSHEAINYIVDRLVIVNLALHSKAVANSDIEDSFKIIEDYKLINLENSPLLRRIISANTNEKSDHDKIRRFLKTIDQRLNIVTELDTAEELLPYVQQMVTSNEFPAALDIMENPLYKVQRDEDMREVKVVDFLDKYYKRTRKRLPLSIQQFEREIHSVELDRDLLEVARRQGLHLEPRYVQEMDLVRYGLIYNRYIDRPAIGSDLIEEKELEAFYNLNYSDTIEPLEIEIFRCAIPTLQKSISYRKKLMQLKSGRYDLSPFKNALSSGDSEYQWTRLIVHRQGVDRDSSLIDGLFFKEQARISNPVLESDGWITYVRGETIVEGTPSFNMLKLQIEARKLKEYKDRRLREDLIYGKKKYQINITSEYQD